MAQSVPQGMQYQAVARDAEGKLLADQAIGIRINLLADGKKDASVYLEEHQARTNELGLFTLTIGAGETIAGNFTEVPWAEHEIWMSLSIDASGDGRYKMLSKSRLLAVPYAFHAGSAGTIAGTQAQQGEGQRTHNGGIQWHLLGNRNANPDFFFLGTIDENDLVIKTNNSERMRITADGKVNIDGDLSVGNNALIGNDLQVNNNANIDNNLNVGGITDLDSDLNVNNMGATNLSGILTVDKAANFNSTLDVNNNSATKLTGTLNVDGASTFNSRMTIDATVSGEQTKQGSYPVLIKGSKQGLAIDLTSATSNTLESGRGNNYISFWEEGTQTGRIEGMNLADLDPTGLVSIISGFVSNPPSSLGIDYSFGSFSLPSPNIDIGTTNVGIGEPINIDFDVIDPSNTSVSFDDGDISNPFGSLDPTFSDILGDPSGPTGSGPAAQIWNNVINPALCNDNLFPDGETQTNFKSQIFSNYTLDILNGSISTLGSIATFATSLASVLDPEDIFSEGVGLVVEITNLIIYGSYADINLGVAYESGAGDYAEWLERADRKETIQPGDVVGVIGGKISKKFTHADRFMAVSTSPIVLGNMPKDAAGEELSEKVAFMGQVPVKVRGLVNIGDYILPSGEGDGTGIAVAPENMLARDYQRIIGVAWENSNPDQFINMINTAVGMNHNDMSKVIEEMQHTMNQMQLAIKEVNPDYEIRTYKVGQQAYAQQPPLDYSVAPSHSSRATDYFEGKTYDSRAEMLQDVKRAMIQEAGINFENVPLVEYMLDHPEQAEEMAAHYQKLLGDMMWITAQVNQASKK